MKRRVKGGKIKGRGENYEENFLCLEGNGNSTMDDNANFLWVATNYTRIARIVETKKINR